MASGPRQWRFVSDMDHNGAITVDDVWSWLGWLYFYPGDVVLSLLINKFPAAAKFFDIYPDNYGGMLSFIISLIIWFGAINLIFYVKRLFVPANKNW